MTAPLLSTTLPFYEENTSLSSISLFLPQRDCLPYRCLIYIPPGRVLIESRWGWIRFMWESGSVTVVDRRCQQIFIWSYDLNVNRGCLREKWKSKHPLFLKSEEFSYVPECLIHSLSIKRLQNLYINTLPLLNNYSTNIPRHIFEIPATWIVQYFVCMSTDFENIFYLVLFRGYTSSYFWNNSSHSAGAMANANRKHNVAIEFNITPLFFPFCLYFFTFLHH